ncbi:B3 domain-containing transcription repressor VAL1-like [Papaver somniferum]|uniref:B3 domain-containing transcription repressor VAL1-like n=1 Tax=Papaver somniferum TaxID=3469 RepID=UPI000E701FE0|nr:B3 domain-containing transcription repressor VAL1-like [Papaver somniferum]
MMSTNSSSSSTKICFNPDCKDTKSERYRKGWRLRTSVYSELCDRCASAYEEGRFCDIFHSNAAGWRNCESCGKRVHCGCIVSTHAFVLLDAGGVDCMGCARKNIMMASNQLWPSSSMPERLKDLSVKNWNSGAGPSAVSGPSPVAGRWLSTPWSAAGAQSEVHPRGDNSSSTSLENKKHEDPSEKAPSTSLNLAVVDRFSNGTASLDTIKEFNPFHREDGYVDRQQVLRNLNGTRDPTDARNGVIAEPGLKSSAPGITVETFAADVRNRVISEPGYRRSASTNITFETLTQSFGNVSVQSCPAKDDRSTPYIGLTLPYSHHETNVPNRISSYQPHLQHPPPLGKPFYPNQLGGIDLSAEAQIRNGRPRGDVRSRNQSLPRYSPRITDQELRQISGDSNSVITPLFEKMLSASDAGRIGRLVLPKKCAEAYFPTISNPEGLPLKVQDLQGREWVFQFRFWPNNNSRMYVLEGVTPCIQSMQLQAGDIVTFSRIDPEGKLVMGCRKASNGPGCDQDNQSSKAGDGIFKSPEGNIRNSKPCEVVSTPLMGGMESTSYSSINQFNSEDPTIDWSKVDKSSYIAKDVQCSKPSVLPSKRKSSTLGSRSKRLRMETEDQIELKLTWEEAQGLLRHRRDNAPSVVVIEGHSFEEYEEAPIIGRPTIFITNNVGERNQWAQCERCSKWRKLPEHALLPSRWICSDNLWDPERSSCSSAQELTLEQLEDILSSTSNDGSKNAKAKNKDSDPVEASEGLGALANVVTQENHEAFASTQQTTTRHPRHKPGCTCIVCSQPPSGKGPKHKDTCTCNVCDTVRRRFRTLMERREKRQLEKEAETARKKQEENIENEDDRLISSSKKNKTYASSRKMIKECDENGIGNKLSSSPFKGGIDLNIQPEREDEHSTVPDLGDTARTMSHGEQPQMLASSDGYIELVVNKKEGVGNDAGGAVKLENDGSYGNGRYNLDTDQDHPVTTLVPVSTSTTG